MIAFLQNIGRTSLAFLAVIGRIALFTAAAIRWTFVPPFYLRQLGRQILDIGYFSLPVVGLTTLFSGMVLALQSYTCLLYTSPSPRDQRGSRMPSSA